MIKQLSTIVFLLAASLVSPLGAQQDITGIWQGELDLGNGEKVLVAFKLERDAQGGLTATVNTPDSGVVKDVKASTVTYAGDELKIDVPDLQGTYTGTLSEGAFRGHWSQAGNAMEMVLQWFNKPKISPGDYARVTGQYAGDAWSTNNFEITKEQDRLYVQPPGQEKRMELIPVDGGASFNVEGVPLTATFMQNDEGNVVSIGMSRGGQSGGVLTRTDVLKAEYEKIAKDVRPNGLSDAVLMGDLETAQALIDAGIDIHELDTRPGIAGGNGRMPLNHAALQNNVEMIGLLLDAGADINGVNRSGFTPLHHAAEAGSLEAAQYLVESGADVNFISVRGATPADIAEIIGHTEVLTVIKEAGGQVSSK